MNDDGDHLGGVTGVLKSIGYAIRQVQPTRVIVVFDGKGGSQSRKKRFSGYKADRDPNIRWPGMVATCMAAARAMRLAEPSTKVSKVRAVFKR